MTKGKTNQFRIIKNPALDEDFDSVEDRGCAPLGSPVATRGRHYASPTVHPLYNHLGNKKAPTELMAEAINAIGAAHSAPQVATSDTVYQYGTDMSNLTVNN